MEGQKTKGEVVEVMVINEIACLHNEIIGYFKKSVEKAIRIGQLLTEQKECLKHGEFTKWIKNNLPFTDRTARNYMRLYNNRDKLKTETVSDLTTGYELLTENRKIESKTCNDIVKYINEQRKIQNNAAEKWIRAERELGKKIEKIKEIARKADRISREIEKRQQKSKEMEAMLQELPDNGFTSEIKTIIENDLKQYDNQQEEWKHQIKEWNKENPDLRLIKVSQEEIDEELRKNVPLSTALANC